METAAAATAAGLAAAMTAVLGSFCFCFSAAAAPSSVETAADATTDADANRLNLPVKQEKPESLKELRPFYACFGLFNSARSKAPTILPTANAST